MNKKSSETCVNGRAQFAVKSKSKKCFGSYRSNEMEKDIQLCPLEENDREQFILDNQEAFNYGAMEEFGCRDNHFEEDGQMISRETIERSIDYGKAYRIILEGKKLAVL